MESIQLAQMLADLSDLNAAQFTNIPSRQIQQQDKQAAVALVSANKTLGTPTASNLPTSDPSSSTLKEQALIRPGQRHHQRMGSSSSILSPRTSSPATFDFGRRGILNTPPLSRTNSAQGSVPGTPRREGAEWEDDVDKAGSLMQLYEIRAKLKQQDNSSLVKLREKIAALKARQDAEKKAGGSGDLGRQNRYTYPKSPLEPDSDHVD
ncbi:hypothetical protein B0H66DRAFT_2211 [Apodospora peruviana]|uniref:Uncharacterized protein n=1 Tax=Apodospora peruviana TaxID=516989 RepID=A0AAE0MDV6_9PEZI|nr:hypothetical protein B0H66DRAFT_2211 [Apodospora peruviana]